MDKTTHQTANHQTKESTRSSQLDMPIIISPPRGILGRCITWKGGTPPKWLIILAPISLNIAFGLYPVVLKLFASGQNSDQHVHTNPYVFTLYRCLGAFPLLFLLSYFVEGSFPIPDIRMTLVFFLFGFIGVFAGQYTYVMAAFIVPADIASAFQPLIPVWTSIVTILLCTEQVPSFIMLHAWAKIGGILVSAGGAVTLALAGPESSESSQPQPDKHWSEQSLGYICLFMDTLFAAIFYSLIKKVIYLSPQNSVWKDYPSAVTGYTYMCGAVFEAMFCLYYLFTGQTEAFHLPQKSLPALVYAVFITSAFCYFLITWSNKYLPSSVITAFWPMQVCSTAAFAYLLLGDTLSHTQVLAAVAILTGLGLVVYSNRVSEKIAQTGQGGIRLDCCFNTHEKSIGVA